MTIVFFKLGLACPYILYYTIFRNCDLNLTKISVDQILFFFRKHSCSLKTHFNAKMSGIRQKNFFIIYFFVKPQWKNSSKKQSPHKNFLFFNNVLGVLTHIIGKQILIIKCKTKVISHLEWFLPIWPWFDLRRSLKVKYKYPKSKAIQWWWYSSIVMKCSDERFLRYDHIYGSNTQTFSGPKKVSGKLTRWCQR